MLSLSGRVRRLLRCEESPKLNILSLQAHDTLQTIHVGLESVVKQLVDVVAAPNQRDVIRQAEDKTRFQALMDEHLEDVGERV